MPSPNTLLTCCRDSSRRAPMWLLAVALAGCAAEGTDFDAIPFYREDRTTPDVVRVEIPPILTTVDLFPTQKKKKAEEAEEKRKDDGSLPGEPEAKDEEPKEKERDYYIRAPWPFGVFQKRGTHQTWTLTGFLGAEGVGNPGPVGRSIASDADVRADPIPTLATDPISGGFAMIPFVFTNTSTDHHDFPDAPEGRDLDEDITLMPFFAWGGGDSEEHEYLAVMPFGGTTKGLLGKEEITWYGFPWPLYAEVKDRAYDSTHVLFPLINWVDGPRNSGFRVLPFYGHYERRGIKGNPIYERTFVMWPFLTWSTSGLNEIEPTETFFFLPFYGQVRGPDVNTTTFLWPFFKYDSRKEGKDGEYWELRAPFPFFILGSNGEDKFKLDMFPFFGFKERKGYHRHFVMWPLWRYESMENDRTIFTGKWAFPFFWQTRWVDKKDGRTRHKFRIFPFFHYRNYRDGRVDAGFLSPWWFDDGGWGRTLQHFLTLYRYQRDKDGGTEHRALMGLFSYRDLPALKDPERPAYSRLSLLFGLFHYRDKGGEKGLRLLWLPEITWDGDDDHDEDPS